MFMLNSCYKDNSLFILGTDIQAYFQHAQVKLAIDGKEVYNGHVTTSDLLGVSFNDFDQHMARIEFQISPGSHNLKVTVNDTITKSFDIQLTNDLFIGVMYAPVSGQVSLLYSNERFMYD